MHLSQEGEDQPDLLVDLEGDKLICDVTVVNPIAPSKLTRAALWDTFGAALHDAQEGKEKKYAHVAHSMGAKVVGLAFDIFGGMSAGSRHLLGRLCTLSQQAVMSISPSEFASRLYGDRHRLSEESWGSHPPRCDAPRESNGANEIGKDRKRWWNGRGRGGRGRGRIGERRRP